MQKPASRSGETASNATPRHTEPPGVPPSMTAAQALPEIGANPGPLPPASPIAGSAAPQPANLPSHEPGAAPTVPVAGLAVEIAAQAQTGKNRFEIRLDPPELGRIDVRLDVDSDGEVTTHLRVDRVETLDLLRRDAPALERTLQQAGLKTSDSGLQFSLRDQAFSQHNHGRETPAMARVVVLDDQLVPSEMQRHYGRLAGLGGGVDIRV
ncbi:MAG TPA: flagellar hook-length control protein FliK [Xanthobacteraceae bacterium]|nr:flagellar hook-length control protein FliK [Xanthobacteraceae bacterium]